MTAAATCRPGARSRRSSPRSEGATPTRAGNRTATPASGTTCCSGAFRATAPRARASAIRRSAISRRIALALAVEMGVVEPVTASDERAPDRRRGLPSGLVELDREDDRRPVLVGEQARGPFSEGARVERAADVGRVDGDAAPPRLRLDGPPRSTNWRDVGDRVADAVPAARRRSSSIAWSRSMLPGGSTVKNASSRRSARPSAVDPAPGGAARAASSTASGKSGWTSNCSRMRAKSSASGLGGGSASRTRRSVSRPAGEPRGPGPGRGRPRWSCDGRHWCRACASDMHPTVVLPKPRSSPTPSGGSRGNPGFPRV